MKNKRKMIGYLIGGIVGLHLATQVVNWTNDLKNAFFQSRERATLKQEFDAKVNGWKADIEKGPHLERIADLAHREQILGELELKITVPSRNYLKKSFPQQISYLIAPFSGAYNRITKDISIEQDILAPGYGTIINGQTLSHEAKHQRTFLVRKIHPEFIERWKALATDKEGKTLYYSSFRNFLARFRGIGHLVRSKATKEENQRLGFINDYARTNVYEDMAELCSQDGEIGCTPNPVAPLLFDPKKKNDRIISKIRLAQEYELIPAEFSEYAHITYDFWKLQGVKDKHMFCVGTDEKFADFLKDSEGFLDKYPDSIYLGAVRHLRGNIFQFREQEDKHDIRQAIEEYTQGLKGSYKNWQGYGLCLGMLEHAYELLGETKKSKIYGEAYETYIQRMQAEDLLLTKKGVDDFLSLQNP